VKIIPFSPHPDFWQIFKGAAFEGGRVGSRTYFKSPVTLSPFSGEIIPSPRKKLIEVSLL